jgi:hypothetical protein
MNKPIALISELVTINNGKYIVKVGVNSNNVILGTALASGDTVEIAEDKARERALALINYSFSWEKEIPISQPKSPSSNDIYQSQKQSNSFINSSDSNQQINQQSETNLAEKEYQSQIEEMPDNISEQTTKFTSQKTIDSSTELVNFTTDLSINSSDDEENINRELNFESTVENDNDSSNLDKPDLPKFNLSPENEFVLPLEFPSKTSMIENLKDKSINNEDKIDNEDNINSVDNLLIFPTNFLSEESTSDLVETRDFTQIIDETTIEMKRLEWTQEQGKKYLLETYGKKSRHLLSDEELIEFLNYLKTQ